MPKLLWKPSEANIKLSNATKLISFVNNKYNLHLKSYQDLYTWSIEYLSDFWGSMWEFGEIKASKNFSTVIEDATKFIGAKWFSGAILNYAENLLRYKDDHLAFISIGENKKASNMTYKALYEQVSRLTQSFRDFGVVKGDHIVAYLPHIPETIIGMLAATSIGATWASCGAELGSDAVINRLGQIKPKVMITADGYWYKGKEINLLDNIKNIIMGIHSLEKVIIVPYVKEMVELANIPKSVGYHEFLYSGELPELIFEQVSFDHPLYIMFSSGTTGKPKCIVQGTGGILINQLKDLMIHTDLKREDRFCYLTSASWMMWNFLTGSLAVGATIVLYNGNPSYPDWETIWKIIEQEKITIFGCSATYIYYLRNTKATPGNTFDLSQLRQISQTGSALSSDGFEWVYKNIKKDLLFNSITGGTDLNGTFAAGTTALPVYAGQIQYPSLGMKVKAYDEDANPVLDQEGELVCEMPFPSMPLYFWDDEDDLRYNKAYFEYYIEKVGKVVWRHGDYMIHHSDTGGITMLGRSDALLKPSGVRIGTSELYNIVEDLFPEINDSLAIGQNWKGDQRILLFLKLAEEVEFTDTLQDRIRKALREKASPRHVPAIIIQTPDIPYTFSGKKVEIAITNIAHNRPVTNRGALSNPESLKFYEKYFQSSKDSS